MFNYTFQATDCLIQRITMVGNTITFYLNKKDEFDSPEFTRLVEEFKLKVIWAEDRQHPLLHSSSEGVFPHVHFSFDDEPGLMLKNVVNFLVNYQERFKERRVDHNKYKEKLDRCSRGKEHPAYITAILDNFDCKKPFVPKNEIIAIIAAFDKYRETEEYLSLQQIRFNQKRPQSKFNQKRPQSKQTSFSFFRALNPVSMHSGIVYCQAESFPCQGTEMLDAKVMDSIQDALSQDLNFFSGLETTFNILVGEHFDLSIKGGSDSKGGAKGLLDFLILPLVARKLIADACLDERKHHHITNALAWTIAVPIEILRFSAGIALTLLLSPVVAMVHLIKFCLSEQETKEAVLSEDNDNEATYVFR